MSSVCDCPNYQCAVLPSCRADILVILTCTASALPHLHTLKVQSHASPVLSSVDASCSVLLLVAAVVTSSLQQLEESLTNSLRDGGVVKGDEGYQWLRFLEAHTELVCSEPRAAKVQNPHLILPLHTTQYGVLLQVYLIKCSD